jgi:hypothetical protein
VAKLSTTERERDCVGFVQERRHLEVPALALVTGAQATIVGWNGRRTTSGAVVAVATFRGEHGLVAKE